MDWPVSGIPAPDARIGGNNRRRAFPDAHPLIERPTCYPSPLMLALDVTRAQFSDMLRLWKANRFKEFHFTLEEEADGSCPVHSWGMGVRLT